MFFHFVKSGDTIGAIARAYRVPAQTLIDDNSLKDPDHLVVNQCLLVRIPDQSYTVASGDNLSTLSDKFHLSIDKIKKANPEIKENNMIFPGQILRIQYSDSAKEPAIINGYCYEQSNRENIRKALPYLTFLSVFAYRAREDGTLSSIRDDDLVDLALQSGVKPIMVITNTKEKGGFSPDLSHAIVSDKEISSRLFSEIEAVLKEKNYYGLNIDFEYVKPSDKEDFLTFLQNAATYFRNRGFYISAALAPKYSDQQQGLLYESHDYAAIGKAMDAVVIMTYEWGYTYGPAMAVAPFKEVERVIRYAASRIDPKKILMGIPNYGYDFVIPHKEGQKARSITNMEAIPIAYQNHAAISHSDQSRTPFFRYKDASTEHEVHFDDPYSVNEKLSLIDTYHLGGASIWTISSDCRYYYLLIDHNFRVEKIR